jgi:hypothetical protein
MSTTRWRGSGFVMARLPEPREDLPDREHHYYFGFKHDGASANVSR